VTHEEARNRLDRPVDPAHDHHLGPQPAEIMLVEYGSYACPHCRRANERIAEVRSRLGERLGYVFRHRPVTGSDLARRAAELVETAPDEASFWAAHVELMTRSETLTEDDLQAVGERLRAARGSAPDEAEAARRARARVDADGASARASGVAFTPTFFVNGRRYDGPWDASSFADALLGTLGHRVRAAALDFASWAPSTGVLLLLATLTAIVLANAPLAAAFEALWQLPFALSAGDTRLQMPLRGWVNDALLTVFFLVVGLEIKREFTVGSLAGARAASLPIAAALGGMAVPAALYVLLVPPGPWAHGWGVPMATDTAFAIALIAMLGRRVPVELRVFLTAAAIVDDIGAILVVALFYTAELNPAAFGAIALVVAALALMNRSGVYALSPYLLLGVVLWACVHASGLHATLTGVVLALFIPTRPPPNLRSLMAQADAVLKAEARHGDEVLRHGPTQGALRVLDAIHDRLESPADRLLRRVAARSSYFVLPLFALANAGVAMTGDVLGAQGPLALAIVVGLVLGKPLGFVLFSALAVAIGLAVKPAAYSWLQLAGAGALAGIGFTMSLFIAGQAFAAPADFAAAKIAVFAASILSSLLGVLLLWLAARRGGGTTEPA
jgi:NhaA family Na+:H+ antiporter